MLCVFVCMITCSYSVMTISQALVEQVLAGEDRDSWKYHQLCHFIQHKFFKGYPEI